MSKIIKPDEPQMLSIQMSPDMARLLASILGEYSHRITPPPEEVFKDKTEEEKTKILSIHDQRKQFALKVCESFFTNAHQ